MGFGGRSPGRSPGRFFGKPAPPERRWRRDSNWQDLSVTGSEMYTDVPLGYSDQLQNVHDQLPSNEDIRMHYRKHKKRRSSRRKREQRPWAWIALLLVLLSTVLVLVALLIVRSRKNRKSLELTETPKSKREMDVVAYLLNVVDHAILSNEASPQRRAVVWMADEDPLQLTPPPVGSDHPELSASFLQRYAVVVLSFHFSLHDQELNFLQDSHECAWNAKFDQDSEERLLTKGVICNGDLKVRRLVLESLGLHGTLPEELGLLTELKILNLDSNLLEFPLPEKMGEMMTLKELSMGWNRLQGTLPSSLGELTGLTSLTMSHNQLEGYLPSSFAQLANLGFLALDQNDLLGDFRALQHLTSLQELYLEMNDFNETLSDGSFAELTNLRILDLSFNRLEGNLPPHLLALPQLEILDLHLNYLESFPDVGSRSTTLQFLDLHSNLLEGPIPTSIDNLQALTHLDISLNRMHGELPEQIGALRTLRFLYLAGNQHFGPQEIPAWLNNLNNLKELSLQATAMWGAIPTFLGDLTDLQLLDMSWNRLNETIPSALGQLTDLEYLMLHRNQLQGRVPQDMLNQLTSLNVVTLDHNRLVGTVGDDFCERDVLPETFYADCGAMSQGCPDCWANNTSIVSVECPCCTGCCEPHDEYCNTKDWLAFFDQGWREGYERTEFIFDN